MTIKHKALMTHYMDGAIIGQELRQLMYNMADIERFAREMPEDPQLYRERKLNTPYRGD